ncbi:CysS/YqeB C-terminal domain-containing protein [Streptomyces sp. NPDC054784]
MDAERGLLALMGSGETSPTMVTLHRELVAHLEPEPGAVVLETPYAFQVNRDDISSRARDYFRRSVGLVTSVAPETADAAWGDSDGVRDRVRRAAWVFSGPGSPSYALDRWAARGMDEVLVERVRRGYGVTVMASAAACTTGFAALPVYEVYKAGHAPAWLEGLDLFGALGLPVAVIPHYDNAEGGTHDTRYCYLGEPRLSALEKELPTESAVLGIDEHTALIIDLDSSAARVWGRGVLTVRRRGVSTLLPAGTSFTLDALRDLVSGEESPDTARPQTASADPPPIEQSASASPATLEEVVNASEERFDAAREKRDARRMTEAVLELEATIAEWGADMEEDQGGSEWARTVLRGMIRQLTTPAQRGMLEPEQSLSRVLAPLLSYRRRLRTHGAYGQADELRDVLARGGVEVRDTDGGSLWLLSDVPESPSRE